MKIFIKNNTFYSKLKKKYAFTLVEIMLVVGIIALLSVIAIPNILRQRVTANETASQSTLKAIGTALENYAALNNGTYPSTTTALTSMLPPYLGTDYFSGTHNGYNYSDTLTSYTYSIEAIPSITSFGMRSFTISTGGVLAVNP